LLSQVSAFAAATPPSLDLREPMAWAANALPPRLDPAKGYQPWSLLFGQGGVPVTAVHARFDLGDTTGRYLEALILARRMGISAPQLSQAEERLERFLIKLIGSDGLVQDPEKREAEDSYSQGNALNGLVALFEDSGDPAVRRAIEKLITAQVKSSELKDGTLVDPSVKLEDATGSHLAGGPISPAIRFYELTGYSDALVLQVVL